MGAEGTWRIVIDTPRGPEESVVEIRREGDRLTGTQSGRGETHEIFDAELEGDTLSWKVKVRRPIPLQLSFRGLIDGERISGEAKPGPFPPIRFCGDYSPGGG